MPTDNPYDGIPDWWYPLTRDDGTVITITFSQYSAIWRWLRFAGQGHLSEGQDWPVPVITPEQMHAIHHAINVVEDVRRIEREKSPQQWSARSLWSGYPHEFMKSRLLGRLLLDGKPPHREPPPIAMGAGDWSSVPGDDDYQPEDLPDTTCTCCNNCFIHRDHCQHCEMFVQET